MVARDHHWDGCPPARHSAMASFTSGRIGSIMPGKAQEGQALLQRVRARNPAGAGAIRAHGAAHSTRRALSAMCLVLGAESRRAASSVMGTCLAALAKCACSGCSTSSGAPLVYCTHAIGRFVHGAHHFARRCQTGPRPRGAGPASSVGLFAGPTPVAQFTSAALGGLAHSVRPSRRAWRRCTG